MAKKQKKKPSRTSQPSAPRVKDFLDMTAPAAVKFNTDSYILGSSFRCTLALRSYPTTTEELALLCHPGETSGVVLHIYIRQATAGEEDAIIHNAQNKNRMDRGNTSNMRRSINAEANLQDVESTLRKNSSLARLWERMGATWTGCSSFPPPSRRHSTATTPLTPGT